MASNEANKPSNQHINQSESKNPPDSLPAIRSDIYSGTEGSFLKYLCQLLSVSDLIKKTAKNCPLCFEDVRRSLCFRKDSCGHFVCMDCLVQHLTVQIEGGNTSINCPAECNELMQQNEIKKYVESDLFTRYEKKGLKYVT